MKILLAALLLALAFSRRTSFTIYEGNDSDPAKGLKDFLADQNDWKFSASGSAEKGVSIKLETSTGFMKKDVWEVDFAPPAG